MGSAPSKRRLSGQIRSDRLAPDCHQRSNHTLPAGEKHRQLGNELRRCRWVGGWTVSRFRFRRQTSLPERRDSVKCVSDHLERSVYGRPIRSSIRIAVKGTPTSFAVGCNLTSTRCTLLVVMFFGAKVSSVVRNALGIRLTTPPFSRHLFTGTDTFPSVFPFRPLCLPPYFNYISKPCDGFLSLWANLAGNHWPVGLDVYVSTFASFSLRRQQSTLGALCLRVCALLITLLAH